MNNREIELSKSFYEQRGNKRAQAGYRRCQRHESQLVSQKNHGADQQIAKNVAGNPYAWTPHRMIDIEDRADRRSQPVIVQKLQSSAQHQSETDAPGRQQQTDDGGANHADDHHAKKPPLKRTVRRFDDWVTGHTVNTLTHELSERFYMGKCYLPTFKRT